MTGFRRDLLTDAAAGLVSGRVLAASPRPGANIRVFQRLTLPARQLTPEAR